VIFRVIRGFCSFSLCRKIIPLCNRTDVQLNVPTKPFFREQLTRDKHRNNGQTQTTNLVRSLDLQSVFICLSSRHLQSLLIFDLHLFNSLHPSLFPVTLSEHPVRLVHSILSHAERSRSTSGRSRRITLSPFFYASTFTSTFSYTYFLLPTYSPTTSTLASDFFDPSLSETAFTVTVALEAASDVLQTYTATERSSPGLIDTRAFSS